MPAVSDNVITYSEVYWIYKQQKLTQVQQGCCKEITFYINIVPIFQEIPNRKCKKAFFHKNNKNFKYIGISSTKDNTFIEKITK